VTRFITTLVLAVSLAACSGGASVPTAKAVEAAALAKKIQADPAKADAILKAAGTDRDAFEALLYDIAQDPEASRAYSDAL
jgi:hypothetical protein